MVIRVKLPLYRFLQDCFDCDCDIGDWSEGVLTATREQFDELVDRTRFYAEDHWEPGECPPELRRSAKAMLKRLQQAGCATA